jgi:hypothetical protein
VTNVPEQTRLTEPPQLGPPPTIVVLASRHDIGRDVFYARLQEMTPPCGLTGEWRPRSLIVNNARLAADLGIRGYQWHDGDEIIFHSTPVGTNRDLGRMLMALVEDGVPPAELCLLAIRILLNGATA